VDRRCEPTAERGDVGGDPGTFRRIAHTRHQFRAWLHPTGPVCQGAKYRHIGRQRRCVVIEHTSDLPSCCQQGVQYIVTLAAAAEDQIDRSVVGRRVGLWWHADAPLNDEALALPSPPTSGDLEQSAQPVTGGRVA